jgi:ribonuclease HII
VSGLSSSLPDLYFEKSLADSYQVACIAGVDEAGRGALAGPVFAAAVILPINKTGLEDLLVGVTDSKLLKPATRARLFAVIAGTAVAYAVGYSSAETIDTIGILPATRQAMIAAVDQLQPAAEALLIDGRIRLTAVNLPQLDIIRGDQRSLSVAAASIMAKVSRDHAMMTLDERYPAYGFARHKGYGTAAHIRMLERLGPCPEHRLSFAPLRRTLI